MLLIRTGQNSVQFLLSYTCFLQCTRLTDSYLTKKCWKSCELAFRYCEGFTEIECGCSNKKRSYFNLLCVLMFFSRNAGIGLCFRILCAYPMRPFEDPFFSFLLIQFLLLTLSPLDGFGCLCKPFFFSQLIKTFST